MIEVTRIGDKRRGKTRAQPIKPPTQARTEVGEPVENHLGHGSDAGRSTLVTRHDG